MANIFADLVEKWIINRQTHQSEFGCRVIAKTTDYLMTPNGDGTADFKYSADFLNEKEEEINDITITMTGLENYQDITQELVEALLGVAFSGSYMDPHDECRWLIAAKNCCGVISVLPYECEECHEQFGEDVDAFIEHLKTTNHNDSFFKTYPEWCKNNL